MAVLQIPKAFKFLAEPANYKVLYSGRSATKSWSIVRQLIINATQSKLLIVCCREVQGSIADSVHRLIADQIRIAGLDWAFHIGKHTIVCKTTGTEFIFKGLFNSRSSESIKSLEGCDICWVEEAQTLSRDSMTMLLPTVRKPGSEVWFSFNPRFPEDAVWETFVANKPPPDSIVEKVSWRDNPFFTQKLMDLMEFDRAVSEARYLHVWEGELNTGYGNLMKRDWWNRWDPEAKDNYILKFVSADTAFSKSTTADYSVLGLFGITMDNLDLLDISRGRWSYPELLEETKDFYDKHSGTNSIHSAPMSSMVVEKKASGQSLIQSLEAEGYDVLPFTPESDKVSRVNAITPLIFRGNIRIPPEGYALWVEDFIAECSAFRDDMQHPHDDQVDVLTQAGLIWQETVSN